MEGRGGTYNQNKKIIIIHDNEILIRINIDDEAQKFKHNLKNLYLSLNVSKI